MASKTRVLGKLKNVAKVVETGPLKLWVAAYQADPGPPLGPQIGQRGVNIAVFCKDFNEKTKLYRPGTFREVIFLWCSSIKNPNQNRKINNRLSFYRFSLFRHTSAMRSDRKCEYIRSFILL